MHLLVCTLFLVIVPKVTFADAQVEITLEPMHPKHVTGKFKMVIVDPTEDSSTLVFEQRVIRFEESSSAAKPVSEIVIYFNCSQGVSVCGPYFDGANKFFPTEIFLDKNLDDIRSFGNGLCDLKYVFSYPASYYLFNFDWSVEEKNVHYFGHLEKLRLS